MTPNGRRLIVSWTAVSLIAAALVAALGSLAGAATGPIVLLVILVEGVVLGAGQRWVLRVARPGLEDHWLEATIGGTLLGRGLEYLGDSGPFAHVVSSSPTIVQYLLAAGFGAVVGAVMAVPQAITLSDRIDGAGWWIAGRGAARGVALPVLFMAGPALFALGALLIGLIEGFVLERLVRGLLCAHETAPPRHGDPSEHAVVVSCEVPLSADGIMTSVQRSVSQPFDGFDVRLTTVCRERVELCIVPCAENAAYPMFEGALRIDDVEPEHARLVLIGRYAVPQDAREREPSEARRLAEDELRRIVDRVACDVAESAR